MIISTTYFFKTVIQIFTTKLFVISGHNITLFGVVILVCAILGSVYFGKWVRNITNKLIISRDQEQHGLAYSLGIIAQYFVTISGILLALDNVGISLSALATFGAILTVGIGFGLQNIAQNFISGIILLLERPVQKGDYIIVGDTVGIVESISLRSTRILSRDNIAIIVPNSKLISETVVNQSAVHVAYRTKVRVCVEYGSNTTLVESTLLELARLIPEVLASPSPSVFFRDFGESSLDFELVVWLKDPGPEPIVTSNLRFRINSEFQRLGIEMPFPQRVIHIRKEKNSETSTHLA